MQERNYQNGLIYAPRMFTISRTDGIMPPFLLP